MRFTRRYYSGGILHDNSSQKIDRDNLCLICQTTDPFEFKDIEIEKERRYYHIYSLHFQEKNQILVKKLNTGNYLPDLV